MSASDHSSSLHQPWRKVRSPPVGSVANVATSAKTAPRKPALKSRTPILLQCFHNVAKQPRRIREADLNAQTTSPQMATLARRALGSRKPLRLKAGNSRIPMESHLALERSQTLPHRRKGTVRVDGAMIFHPLMMVTWRMNCSGIFGSAVVLLTKNLTNMIEANIVTPSRLRHCFPAKSKPIQRAGTK